MLYKRADTSQFIAVNPKIFEGLSSKNLKKEPSGGIFILETLQNLYFVYLLEMRAFAKAAPYLNSLSYFTGDVDEDAHVKS